jgi:starvation-inducible DNA-binding protein
MKQAKKSFYATSSSTKSPAASHSLKKTSTIQKVDIGIDDADREIIVHGLSRLLADSYTLYLKTHNFHWNVEGPMFNALHQMFMDQYTELWNALDLIAERIRALGAYAPGSHKKYSALASIEESEETLSANAMIKALLEGHEAVARTIRSVFPLAESAGDESTLDLLTQRLQLHEKTAWMLRALLKK